MELGGRVCWPGALRPSCRRVSALPAGRLAKRGMCSALGKMMCLGKEMFLIRAFSLSRVTAAKESRICAVGSTLLNCNRHYRSQPSHGIGRFRHLVPVVPPKKKRDKLQMKEINPGSDHYYGDLNIQMTGHDMCLVESYAQYVHRLCNQFSIKVIESYAMPTKTTEMMLVSEKNSRLYLDAVLTTHERVVQIGGLSSTFAPVLLEVIQSNQPEGVHLAVKEHTEADFKVRLKARPELEELIARLD